MPKRDLELEVCRHGRHVQSYDVTADPHDTIGLRDFLVEWLRSEKWDERKWGEFTLVVRYAGTHRPFKRIRTGS